MGFHAGRVDEMLSVRVCRRGEPQNADGSGGPQHVLFVREFAMVGCFSQTVM